MAGINVGSVSVTIVPDAERFVAEIASKIVPSAAKAGDEYASVFADSAQIRLDAAHLTATIRLNADTADADAQLAATDAEADRVARTRDLRIDDHGSIGKAGTGLSGLLTTLVAFGPALIPVGAALVGAFAGAVPAMAAAGAGLGVAALAFSGVASTVTELGQRSTATGAALTTLNRKLAGVNPATLAFAKFIRADLLPAFDHLKSVAAAGLLPGVEAGLKAMTPLIKPLTTFVGNLAKTMGNLATEAGKALTNPFWTKFFTYVGNIAAPILVTMGHIVGNLAKGLAGLLEAFVPITRVVGAGLVSLSARFAAFGAGAGKNAGFQAFLAYIKAEGPVVVQTLGSVVGAFSRLVVALAPIGAVSLRAIGQLANLIKAIPVPVLTALAAVLIPLVVGVKLVTLALKAWKETQTALNLVLAANPIVLAVIAIAALAVAFVEVYRHSQTFRNFINDKVLPVLHEIWQFIQAKLVPVLEGILAGALSGVRTAFDLVRQAIQRNKPQLMELLNAWKDYEKFIVEKVLPLLGPILKEAFRGIGIIIGDDIKIIGFLVRAFNGMVSAGRSVGSFFTGPFVNFFTSAWAHVRSAFTSGLSFIRSIPGRIVSGLGDLGSLLISAGESLISGLASGIVSGIGKSLLGALHSVTSTITSHFPHSPAKMGPLRDFPPETSGQRIVEQLAGGMVGAIPSVQEASARIAASLAGLGLGVTVPTFTHSPLSASGTADLSYNGVNPAMFTAHAHDTAAGTLTPAAGGPASFEGNLYLDSGEFLGVVRGEATSVVKSRAARVATTVRKAT